MERKNFIFKNEGFVCRNCKKENPPLKTGCRNHCIFCLYSVHVDEDVPGDRNSHCEDLMEPISLDYNGKKGFIIIHKCKSCGIIRRNKVAPDDNQELIYSLSSHE